jgi:hypothetical protein
VSVLSDGLGSGIKAGVLATLTSTMSLQFVTHDTDIRQTAKIMMDTLPVCSERRIAYSTFTIVDIEAGGRTRIIEHDNPPFLALRGAEPLAVDKTGVGFGTVAGTERERRLFFSEVRAQVGDRIVFFSDGVTQAGMGRDTTPLGWGMPAVTEYVCSLVRQDPQISARELARRVVGMAQFHDRHRPKDDITCGVIYFRRPRRLLVVTGPPFDAARDRAVAESVAEFPGKTVICGGTTATIISRELRLPLDVDMENLMDDVPPMSRMPGIELITEGTITLAKAADILEQHRERVAADLRNPASLLVNQLLDSDVIEFTVGTRINQAHQDPDIPVELDLRRNIVKRIKRILEDEHLKETSLRFV